MGDAIVLCDSFEDRWIITDFAFTLDGPPDGNFAGYDFWLAKLNAADGNYISSDMVKAFITSGEYRGRFGP